MRSTRRTHQGPLLFYPEIERRSKQLTALRRRKLSARSQIRERERRTMADTVGFHNQPQEKMLRDYFVPSNEDAGSPLVYPDVAAENFELRSNMIQWVQQACTFYGLPNEDPNDHLRTFIRICSTIKIKGLSEDDIKLRLFPFTLMDRAQTWLNNLENNSIDSWAKMRQAFLEKYIPPSKVASYRQAIMNFQQLESETMYEAWKRFKELMKKCPQHGVEDQMQLTIFYNSLLPDAKVILDASARGSFMMKRVSSAKKLLDDMASNHA